MAAASVSSSAAAAAAAAAAGGSGGGGGVDRREDAVPTTSVPSAAGQALDERSLAVSRSAADAGEGQPAAKKRLVGFAEDGGGVSVAAAAAEAPVVSSDAAAAAATTTTTTTTASERSFAVAAATGRLAGVEDAHEGEAPLGPWEVRANTAICLRVVRTLASATAATAAAAAAGAGGGGGDPDADSASDADAASDADSGWFHPVFTHQVFGEQERIRGYRGLRVELTYNAATMDSLLQVSHEARVSPTDVSFRGQADDPRAALLQWLREAGAPPAETREAFLATFGGGPLPPGDSSGTSAAAATSTSASGGTAAAAVAAASRTNSPAPHAFGRVVLRARHRGRTYEVRQASLAEDAGAAAFHRKVQMWLIWNIDGSNFLDTDDDRWEAYFMFEVQNDDDGGHDMDQAAGPSAVAGSTNALSSPPVDGTGDYVLTGEAAAAAATAADETSPRARYFTGLLTVYNYFAYPDLVRKRISQVCILPPYQGRGLGRVLLEAFHALCMDPAERVKDVTVEDPTLDFSCLRDAVDLARIRRAGGQGWLDAPTPYSSSSSEQQPGGDGGDDDDTDKIPQAHAEALRRELRIHPKQAQHLFEISRFGDVFGLDRDLDDPAARPFRLRLKRRLFNKYQDLLANYDTHLERLALMTELFAEMAEAHRRVLRAAQKMLGEAPPTPATKTTSA